MSGRAVVGIVVAISTFASPALADDVPADRSATAQWMIQQAKAWAEQACGGKWVISDLLAEDFRGTSPKGARYGKPTAEPARSGQRTAASMMLTCGSSVPTLPLCTGPSRKRLRCRTRNTSGAVSCGPTRGSGARGDGRSSPFKTTSFSVL